MRQIKIAAAALALVMISSFGSAFAADECGPVGDPPAKLNQGIIATTIMNHNPICFGGRVVGPWKDSDGTDRYACLYEPAQASRDNPLPLLVFLHPSLATADSIKLTGLTSENDKVDLGGAKPGYLVIAVEGRYTSHYYPAPDSNAMGWDNWYRQLNPSGDVTIAGATYKENVDAATIDHFIQGEVATGEVDAHRIYLSGWSNGAAMAILYTLNRPSIAAAAVYSAPDPFGASIDPCPQTPVARLPTSNTQVQLFNPRTAIMHVRNSCDIGGICPSGNTLATQLHQIGTNLEDVILDSDGKRVTACDDACGTSPMANGEVGVIGSTRGFAHHMMWPKSWNPMMFDFLKHHPLAGAKSESTRLLPAGLLDGSLAALR